MGIVRTDQWLDEDFHEPLKICRKFMGSFNEENPDKIYSYLSGFGMYRPNRLSRLNFERLKEGKFWDKTEKIYKKYQKKWNGPEVSVYIFPMAIAGFFSNSRENKKSGVSFKDKIFLFITPLEDEMELEALFVHEYHHVCRIVKQGRKLEDYNLLDSIILEGLAEHAVEEYCGKNYRTKWCTYYSNKEVLYYWKQILGKKLNTKKSTSLHDQILYGEKEYPRMIGYAAGYKLISLFKEKQTISIRDSFGLSSKSFIKHFE